MGGIIRRLDPRLKDEFEVVNRTKGTHFYSIFNVGKGQNPKKTAEDFVYLIVSQQPLKYTADTHSAIGMLTALS